MGRGRSQNTRNLLAASRTILEEIQPCSVRSVCYRLFILGLLRSMGKGETNRVSRLLTLAREHGELPWAWITDETRVTECASQWRDPEAFMATARRSYRKDHWEMQSRHVEVWSEKGTIRGTVQPVLDEFGVPFRVMHGYGSATALYDIAQSAARSPKPWVALYAGDHDPSGLHMSEVDLPRRLEQYGASSITITRLALTRSDVMSGALPSFSLMSKGNDPRLTFYIEQTRDFARKQSLKCWEIDALSPVILRARLRAAIVKHIDSAQWERSRLAEAAEQQTLATCFSGWQSIVGQAQE